MLAVGGSSQEWLSPGKSQSCPKGSHPDTRGQTGIIMAQTFPVLLHLIISLSPALYASLGLLGNPRVGLRVRKMVTCRRSTVTGRERAVGGGLLGADQVPCLGLGAACSTRSLRASPSCALMTGAFLQHVCYTTIKRRKQPGNSAMGTKPKINARGTVTEESRCTRVDGAVPLSRGLPQGRSQGLHVCLNRPNMEPGLQKASDKHLLTHHLQPPLPPSYS